MCIQPSTHINFTDKIATKLLILHQNFSFQIKCTSNYIANVQKPCNIQEIIILNHLHVYVIYTYSNVAMNE